MKLAKIFGVVSLAVFLMGVTVLASRDITFARENDNSNNVTRSVQSAAGTTQKEQDDLKISANGTENDGDDDVRTGNITGIVTIGNYRGEAENDNDDEGGNVTVSSNRSENENEHEGGNITGNVTVSGNRTKSDDDDRNIAGSDDGRGEQEHGNFGRAHQPAQPPAASPNATVTSNGTIVSYSQVIQPILNQRCNSCHPKPGVNLSNYAGTKAAVSKLPGMGQSYLTSAELQSLLTWIKQGALNN